MGYWACVDGIKMTEKPILFKSDMVSAILDGIKTQTRRVIKLPPVINLGHWEVSDIGGHGIIDSQGYLVPNIPCIWHTHSGWCIACPYGKIGDQLWVRETFAYDDENREFLYRADNNDKTKNWDLNRYGSGSSHYNWKSSIFMPRKASRIQLEITNIRIERLNDISDDDAKAEGVTNVLAGGIYDFIGHIKSYQRLWEQINGNGSWSENPFVWVIEFKNL
jgi:hypothetical protein